MFHFPFDFHVLNIKTKQKGQCLDLSQHFCAVTVSSINAAISLMHTFSIHCAEHECFDDFSIWRSILFFHVQARQRAYVHTHIQSNFFFRYFSEPFILSLNNRCIISGTQIKVLLWLRIDLIAQSWYKHCILSLKVDFAPSGNNLHQIYAWIFLLQFPIVLNSNDCH